MDGWKALKKRSDLVFKKICGESNAVDDSVCTQWITDLPSLISNYSANDIFNADESGLFFKCFPDKTFTLKGRQFYLKKIFN